MIIEGIRLATVKDDAGAVSTYEVGFKLEHPDATEALGGEGTVTLWTNGQHLGEVSKVRWWRVVTE